MIQTPEQITKKCAIPTICEPTLEERIRKLTHQVQALTDEINTYVHHLCPMCNGEIDEHYYCQQCKEVVG